MNLAYYGTELDTLNAIGCLLCIIEVEDYVMHIYAIANAIMSSVCAAIMLAVIHWLGFPLAFQLFLFLLLLCSPAGFIVFSLLTLL